MQGATTLALLDPPSLGDLLPTGPTLLIAAAGASARWRKAALTISLDDGGSWQSIGGTAAPAVMGHAAILLAPSGSALRDMANGVDIALLSDVMALAGSDATGSSATANLALLGDELIQFAGAAQIGPRLFRLSGLLRGRRGSEWAMAGHAIGERFVLIDLNTLLPWPLPSSAIGHDIRVSASGVGDVEPAELAITFLARVLRPPSPVALSATPMPDGSISIGWTRRSRAGWDWLDDTDAPLAEEMERYQLLVVRSGGTSLAISASAPAMSLTPAQIAAIGGSGAVTVAIAQVGTSAASLPPVTLLISWEPDMTDATARFALPFIASGQAQKELFHNEALARIDALLQPVVEAVRLNTPPAAPVPGQCWIVGAAPSGAWSGQALAIVACTDEGWRFVAPRAAMRAGSLADTLPAMFDGASWTLGAVHAPPGYRGSSRGRRATVWHRKSERRHHAGSGSARRGIGDPERSARTWPDRFVIFFAARRNPKLDRVLCSRLPGRIHNKLKRLCGNLATVSEYARLRGYSSLVRLLSVPRRELIERGLLCGSSP